MTRSGFRRQLTMAGVAACLIVILVPLAGCGRMGSTQADKPDAESEAALEALEAKLEDAEARILEESQARADAEAAAGAQAETARQAMATSERQLEETGRLLREREAQLERQQELQRKQDELAARVGTLESKEKDLFERQRELEAREVEVALAEDEIRQRAEAEELGADAQAYEPSDWIKPVVAVEPKAEPAPVESPGNGIEPEQPVGEGHDEAAALQPGKVIEVELLETLSSQTHRVGDTFVGQLVQDLRAENGSLVAEAGSEVEGVVVEVTPLRRVGGQASIGIEFTRISTAPGEALAIRASVSQLGADRKKERKKIIGATVAGAILGRVLGGKGGENAAVGAVVGAAAGTAAAARAEGKDAVIPAGEIVALQLEEVVTVEIEVGAPVEPQ